MKTTPEEQPSNWKYIGFMPVRLVLSLIACAALLISAVVLVVVVALAITLIMLLLWGVCLGWVFAPRTVRKVSSEFIEEVAA